MLTFDQYISEAKVEVFYDDSFNGWGSDMTPVIKFLEKAGNKVVAVMGNKALGPNKEFVIAELSDFDKNLYKGLKVKAGTSLYRYATKTTVAGKLAPLVAANLEKGVVYFMTDESMEADEPVLEKKIGFKANYVRIIK